MQFVLDENLYRKPAQLPENTINATDLYQENNLNPKGIPDSTLLILCVKKCLTLITRDQGLILKANKLGIDIVFAHGNDNMKWTYIPKERRIKNREKLIKYSTKNSYEDLDELNVIPFFASRKRGEVEF